MRVSSSKCSKRRKITHHSGHPAAADADADADVAAVVASAAAAVDAVPVVVAADTTASSSGPLETCFAVPSAVTTFARAGAAAANTRGT